MTHIYEYLFSGILIVVILASSIAAISSLSYPSTSQTQKQNLQTTAEKIFNQLLIDPGYPTNWGTITDEPTIFGLARSGDTSRQAYFLDENKVLRLKSNSPTYLNPKTAVTLLNLGRDYGFTLEIKPKLKISQTDLGGNTFEIKVENQNGIPIKNVQVVATLYYYDQEKIKIEELGPDKKQTGSDGLCQVNLGGTIDNSILAVSVDYYGTTCSQAFPIGQVTCKNIFYREIFPPVVSPDFFHDVATQVYSVNQQDDYNIKNFNVTKISGSQLYEFKMGYEPEKSMIALIAILNGGDLVLTTRDFTLEGSTSYSTLANPEQNFAYSPLSYSIERTVYIAATTYTVTLYVWRMSI